MKVEECILKGVFIIENFSVRDNRGLFEKTFNKDAFNAKGLSFNIRETYFSISEKDVIRGMHFQLPPYDHEKLVFVPVGAIVDVIVDLRKNSPTYQQFMTIELSSVSNKSIFIPRGMAHGFKSLVNDTVTVYSVGSEYNQMADTGIHYNSFGLDWEISRPIVSQRDEMFPGLASFCEKNPFK